MLFRDALKIVRRRCVGEPTGNINEGQIVKWADTHNEFTFVPDHAYAKEGRLFVKDLKTGKSKEL